MNSELSLYFYLFSDVFTDDDDDNDDDSDDDGGGSGETGMPLVMVNLALTLHDLIS